TAVVEILQNCVIFADKVHEDYYGVKTRKDTLVYLHHGEKMMYGKSVEKGLSVDGFKFCSVDAGTHASQIYTHDETEETGAIASMLSKLQHPDFPVPLGVFRAIQRPVYHEMMHGQIEAAKKAGGEADLAKL